jgi:hypothetical protein
MRRRLASVRAKLEKATITSNTGIYADSTRNSGKLLAAKYGSNVVASFNKVSETELANTAPNKIISKADQRILPTKYAHSRAQKALLNQMKRNALHVKPTIDDLKVAQSDFEAEQKRVNSEYEKWAEGSGKAAEIRKRKTIWPIMFRLY